MVVMTTSSLSQVGHDSARASDCSGLWLLRWGWRRGGDGEPSAMANLMFVCAFPIGSKPHWNA